MCPFERCLSDPSSPAAAMKPCEDCQITPTNMDTLTSTHKPGLLGLPDELLKQVAAMLSRDDIFSMRAVGNDRLTQCGLTAMVDQFSGTIYLAQDCASVARFKDICAFAPLAKIIREVIIVATLSRAGSGNGTRPIRRLQLEQSILERDGIIGRTLRDTLPSLNVKTLRIQWQPVLECCRGAERTPLGCVRSLNFEKGWQAKNENYFTRYFSVEGSFIATLPSRTDWLIPLLAAMADRGDPTGFHLDVSQSTRSFLPDCTMLAHRQAEIYKGFSQITHLTLPAYHQGTDLGHPQGAWCESQDPWTNQQQQLTRTREATTMVLEEARLTWRFIHGAATKVTHLTIVPTSEDLTLPLRTLDCLLADALFPCLTSLVLRTDNVPWSLPEQDPDTPPDPTIPFLQRHSTTLKHVDMHHPPGTELFVYDLVLPALGRKNVLHVTWTPQGRARLIDLRDFLASGELPLLKSCRLAASYYVSQQFPRSDSVNHLQAHQVVHYWEERGASVSWTPHATPGGQDMWTPDVEINYGEYIMRKMKK